MLNYLIPSIKILLLKTFESSKTKNGGFANHGPPQGFMNGLVDHLGKRAFCYKLPVLYKVAGPSGRAV